MNNIIENLIPFQKQIDDGESVAQVQIWLKQGETLALEVLKGLGYDSIAAYVLALQAEGKKSLPENQRTKFDHLPLVSVGKLDKFGKHLLCIYEDENDLENLTELHIE